MKGLYQEAVKIWMEEKINSEIQNIPDDFYKRMAKYVLELRKHNRMLDKTSLNGIVSEKEMEFIIQMLKELLQLRLGKIIFSELKGNTIKESRLTSDEKIFHAEFRNILENYNHKIKDILRGNIKFEDASVSLQKTKATSSKFRVIRFIKPLPAIMGVDMKKYGPFKKEDIASIPKENAENLIRRGFAKVVEINP
jgi:DNA replication factor GINS